jgi:hypothetical protein
MTILRPAPGRWLAMALLLAWPAAAGAQQRVAVRDAGPGQLGRLVAAALQRPHDVVAGDSSDVVLRRDTTLSRTLVVIGRDVRIASALEGDLVVIGGDAFLRPGVRIEGSVITAGGGIYNTMLGTVEGERHAFRDETLVATLLPDGTYALDYRALRTREYATFSLPFPYGARIPSYDRVNGVTLPWAPFIQLDSGTISIEPTLSYRSHLGKIDPSVIATRSMGRRSRVTAFAGRTTRTNDAWISGDLGNSISSFWAGRDKRNWYRADVVEAAFHRRWEGVTSEVTPYVGAQWERAWSTGIQAPPRHLAYSVLDRRDTVEGMARPNPAVARGVIASAIAGFTGTWESPAQQLEARGSGRIEVAPVVLDERRFSQFTLDAGVAFPVFRKVEFRSDLHGVATVGDAPPQRYAYLGGSGTLKTLDLLSEGGDQLLFVESRATLPFERFTLPFVGPPSVSLMHAMGAAGVGGLPGLTHNLGVRVSVRFVRVEFVFDPVSGDSEFGFGVAFSP